jgi:hypothetical protein
MYFLCACLPARQGLLRASVVKKVGKIVPAAAMICRARQKQGFLLGPPVIGWIAEVANLRYSFALIAVLGFCITLLASRAKIR